ncbi:MAG TPA: hypothetical protein VIM73_15265 [Polyangiaceae bacterium]
MRLGYQGHREDGNGHDGQENKMLTRGRIAATLSATAAAIGLSVAAALPAGAAGTSTTATAPGSATKVAPCTMNDVSFYFGGASEGLSQRSFDLTLLAHDGITCSLSDTPLIELSGPPSQTSAIPLHVNGRGGTLILRPDSPLHATFSYSAPDTQQDTMEVSTLILSMPDKTSRATYFLVPGTTDIDKDGVLVTSWTTGIGLGQGEEAF